MRKMVTDNADEDDGDDDDDDDDDEILFPCDVPVFSFAYAFAGLSSLSYLFKLHVRGVAL